MNSDCDVFLQLHIFLTFLQLHVHSCFSVQETHVYILRTKAQNEREGKRKKEGAEEERSDRRKQEADGEGDRAGQAGGQQGQERLGGGVQVQGGTGQVQEDRNMMDRQTEGRLLVAEHTRKLFCEEE